MTAAGGGRTDFLTGLQAGGEARGGKQLAGCCPGPRGLPELGVLLCHPLVMTLGQTFSRSIISDFWVSFPGRGNAVLGFGELWATIICVAKLGDVLPLWAFCFLLIKSKGCLCLLMKTEGAGLAYKQPDCAF